MVIIPPLIIQVTELTPPQQAAQTAHSTVVMESKTLGKNVMMEILSMVMAAVLTVLLKRHSHSGLLSVSVLESVLLLLLESLLVRQQLRLALEWQVH